MYPHKTVIVVHPRTSANLAATGRTNPVAQGVRPVRPVQPSDTAARTPTCEGSGWRGVRSDIDTPARQPGGKSSILSLTTNR